MSLYDLINPTKATRIIHDGSPEQRQIRIAAGEEIMGVALAEQTAKELRAVEGDLVVLDHDPNRPKETAPSKPPIVLDGRFGIGDAIHQRGPIRELMQTHEVWLASCHFRVYEDLVERGLKLIFKDCRLHAQAKTIARERSLFPHAPPPPPEAPRFNLSYGKDLIDRYGSIVEAMAGCVGVKARPLDFSLPVSPEWTEALKRRFPWIGSKPLMVYRPIVLRREWNGANRNPDPVAYSRLYDVARRGFFVVSVADLAPGTEWIVGPDHDADLKLHKGELTFEDMAALWKEAAIVFCNAGFGPVLAQAVGTPNIVVYGGRECYRTTQRAGEHLAPTLGIDPDHPCDCMSERHACGDRRIAFGPASEKVKAFVRRIRQAEEAQRSRQEGVGDAQAAQDRPGGGGKGALGEQPGGGGKGTLVFATTYVDSDDRERLTRQWLDLHVGLNPECDFLLVDSASPRPVLDSEWDGRFKAEPTKLQLFDFCDNVGHLSRNGRDGWGRAFCRGLDHAVQRGYDFVVHIEGDSLLRVPVREIVAKLKESGKGAASIPVKGTSREIPGWVETGLMCFSIPYLKRSRFTALYDWPAREVRPTPEFVVPRIIGDDLLMLGLNGKRGDKNEISARNIRALDLDWVTHCHSDIDVYREFVEANLPPQSRVASTPIWTNRERGANTGVAVVVGGAAQVWQEVQATKDLLAQAGLTPRWFVVNDMIPRFNEPVTAITLHPPKIGGWLAEREKAGYPKPDQVWAHVKQPGVSHVTEDWRGSSGLFAVKVALKLGFRRIILCGVPMEAKGGHIVRGPAPWAAADQFLGGWRAHQKEIAPFVRSWSGWTEKAFGRPSVGFLEARAAA